MMAPMITKLNVSIAISKYAKSARENVINAIGLYVNSITWRIILWGVIIVCDFYIDFCRIY